MLAKREMIMTSLDIIIIIIIIIIIFIIIIVNLLLHFIYDL